MLLPIREKIDEAWALYRAWGERLRRDERVRALLDRLQRDIEASMAAMEALGVVEACERCEQEEGGSCCGAGIEDHYDRIQLLINLLLGVRFPESRALPDGCYFLGPRGCGLRARHVLCVNYLCARLEKQISLGDRIELQRIVGGELNTCFLLHEAIKGIVEGAIRDEGRISRTLARIAAFYDGCKIGYQGNEGYRKSTDLYKLGRCASELASRGILRPGRTVFLDLGCADGRVNILMSYFVRASLGIEIDPDILAEFGSRSRSLVELLEAERLEPPPRNIFLFQGDSLDGTVYERIWRETGLRFEDVDLFYTYITLHDRFAERIARDAKNGAFFLVYGFHRVLPRYPGLQVAIPDVGGQGIAAMFSKGPS